MLAYVDQATNTQTVVAKDTAGTISGNAVLCGPRTFTISTGISLSFFSVSQEGPLDPTKAKLSLGTTNPEHATVSPIMVTITATLDSYPSVPPAT